MHDTNVSKRVITKRLHTSMAVSRSSSKSKTLIKNPVLKSMDYYPQCETSMGRTCRAICKRRTHARLKDVLVEQQKGSRRKGSLSAGFYAFHGSHGCAFTPPLAYEAVTPETAAAGAGAGAAAAAARGPDSCPTCGRGLQGRSQKLPPERQIGKVMRYDAAWAEYRQAHRVEKLDPSHLFGLYPDPPVRVLQEEAASSAGGPDQLMLGMDVDVVRALLDGEEPGLPHEARAYQLIMERAMGDLLVVLGPMRATAPALPQVRAHMHALRNLYAGLQHMHAQGICHLDIKPENCVVLGESPSRPSAYKFIDFGLSKSFAELEAAPATPSRQVILNRLYSSYPAVAFAWWRSFPAGGAASYRQRGESLESDSPPPPPPEGQHVAEFEDDPFQTRSRSHTQEQRMDKTVELIQNFHRSARKECWEPLYRPYNRDTLKLESEGMLQLYAESEKTAGNGQTQYGPRVVAARAADVFGLGRVTAFVYYCVAKITYSYSATRFKENPTWGHDPLNLQHVHAALGQLVFDMMHSRVRSDQILARFDGVLLLFPA